MILVDVSYSTAASHAAAGALDGLDLHGSPVIDVPSLISPGVSELERFPLDLNRGGFRRRAHRRPRSHLEFDWTAQVGG
jgi:hypothetical protein